jgi:hypothetical protein
VEKAGEMLCLANECLQLCDVGESGERSNQSLLPWGLSSFSRPWRAGWRQECHGKRQIMIHFYAIVNPGSLSSLIQSKDTLKTNHNLKDLYLSRD